MSPITFLTVVRSESVRQYTKFMLAGLLLCTLLIGSCKRENPKLGPKKNPASNVLVQTTPCGTAFSSGMFNGTDSIANVKVTNTVDTLFITYTSVKPNWKIKSTKLYAGNCDSIPKTSIGGANASRFPYGGNYSPFVSTVTFRLPLSKLSACFCLSAEAMFVELDASGNLIMTAELWAKGVRLGGESTQSAYFSYCKQSCGCVINVGDFTTFTQGGWGAVPHGNNPGVYLHANFSAAFPTGLVIGCTGNYTATFTTAQAITDFLPCGGTSAALTSTTTNPACFNNVFASQVLTLSLSVGFDNHDPNFSASSVPLQNMVIASGPFSGWTIARILTEANKVLGGCTSSYTAAQLNSAITSINENFDGGSTNNGFVTCP